MLRIKTGQNATDKDRGDVFYGNDADIEPTNGAGSRDAVGSSDGQRARLVDINANLQFY